MIFDSSTLAFLARIDVFDLFLTNFEGIITITEKERLELSRELPS